MSKSIWHTADEKPMLHRDIILCGDGWSMAIDVIPETVDNICWRNVEKWCYLDDLLALETELDRTRKALDVAKDAIDVISLKYHKDTPSIFLIKYAQNAKAEITTLEQKEVK